MLFDSYLFCPPGNNLWPLLIHCQFTGDAHVLVFVMVRRYKGKVYCVFLEDDNGQFLIGVVGSEVEEGHRFLAFGDVGAIDPGADRDVLTHVGGYAVDGYLPLGGSRAW